MALISRRNPSIKSVCTVILEFKLQKSTGNPPEDVNSYKTKFSPSKSKLFSVYTNSRESDTLNSLIPFVVIYDKSYC